MNERKTIQKFNHHCCIVLFQYHFTLVIFHCQISIEGEDLPLLAPSVQNICCILSSHPLPPASCGFPSPILLSYFSLDPLLTQSLDTLPLFLIPPPQFLCFHSACCPLFQLSVHCKKYLNRRSHFENSSPLAASPGWGVAKQLFSTQCEGRGRGSALLQLLPQRPGLQAVRGLNPSS